MKASSACPTMAGGGHYNANAHIQYQALLPAFQILERAAHEVAASSAVPRSANYTLEGVVHIADMGAGQGANSMEPVQRVVKALTEHTTGPDHMHGKLQLVVSHTDLPSNDFASLLELIHRAETTYVPAHSTNQRYKDSTGNIQAFHNIVGASFYQRLFPDTSLHLALCLSALQFLSRMPDPRPLDVLAGGASRDPAVREAFDRQSQADIALFLRLRAAEMAPGAGVVFTMPCRGDKPPPLAGLRCFQEEASRLLAAKELSPQEFNAMVLPVNLLMPEDIREVLERDPETTGAWELRHFSTEVAVHPAWGQLQRGEITAQQYGGVVGSAFHAIFRDIFIGALAETRGEEEATKFVDTLFQRAGAAVAAAPDVMAQPWSYAYLVRRGEFVKVDSTA